MAVGRCCLAFSVVFLAGLCGCALTRAPQAHTSAFAGRDRERAEQFNGEGLALVAEGEFAEAEERFREAVRCHLYHGPAYNNLGVSLLQQGKYHEAAINLNHAAKLMPKASQPRLNLGLIFEAVGQFGQAEEELRKALRLFPDDIEVIGHLARVHVRQGKQTAETTAWLQAVAMKDDDPAWRNWAGTQLARTGNKHDLGTGHPNPGGK